jgi:hypothetical protein
MEVKVKVLYVEEYDDKWPSESLMEFAEWFDGQVDSIPKAHRDSAKIEFAGTAGYDGDTTTSIEIYYHREETKKERDARTEKDKTRAASMKGRELKELNRLREKYCDSSGDER